MLKLLKRFFLLIIAIVIIIFSYEIHTGYQMYISAISNLSISEMVSEVKQKENYTVIDEMPDLYIKAVVAVEDHRFYVHSGIDFLAITRAFINDVKAKSFVEGGSTITQQLAKNTYFTQEKKIERKIAELFMAFRLESELTKEEILELYLNTCYFGEGCYTVSEASNMYFNKKPQDMNEYECTLLAGVPNAPSVYAPTRNLNLAEQRQRQVLDKMVEYGIITLENANQILKKD